MQCVGSGFPAIMGAAGAPSGGPQLVLAPEKRHHGGGPLRSGAGMFLSVRLRTSYVGIELFVPLQPYGFLGLWPFGAVAIWGCSHLGMKPFGALAMWGSSHSATAPNGYYSRKWL